MSSILLIRLWQVEGKKIGKNMNKERPKQKRRGGVRDEGCLTVNMTRRQLAAHLDIIRLKCELWKQREPSIWARR